MILVFAEACFALLVAAAAIRAPLPPVPALVLLVLLAGLSLVPALARPAGEGRLRRDRLLVLPCLFLLTLSVRFPAEDLAGWWPALTAFLLALCGLFSVFRDRFPWSRLRTEVTLGAAVLLVASGAVAVMLHGVLALRSTMAIAPGSLNFLLVLPVWLGAWFGLDAHLRGMRDSSRPGVPAWLFNRRHSLGLLICLAVILLRTGFS